MENVKCLDDSQLSVNDSYRHHYHCVGKGRSQNSDELYKDVRKRIGFILIRRALLYLLYFGGKMWVEN